MIFVIVAESVMAIRSEVKMTEDAVDQDGGSTSYLIKGCPCLMEFGTEHVCINNDDVTEVYYMDIPMEMFHDGIVSSAVETGSSPQDETKVCYGIVNLGRADGIARCALHQVPLRINGVPIRSADIEDAIQFSLISENDLVCPSCIYKYLVTMGGIFEEEVSSSEANRIIEAYLSHSEKKLGENGLLVQKDVTNYRAVLRTHLRELVKEKQEWSKLVREHHLSGTGEGNLRELIDLYRSTSRMEMILHHQLIALQESDVVPRPQPRLITKSAEQIISLCKKIQEMSDTLLDSAVPVEVELTIRRHMKNRESIEKGIQSLLQVMGSRRPE